VAAAVIEFGLLGAIAHGTAAGSFDDLCVGSVDFDLGDVGASFGRREGANVLREEGESGLVVVSAEEIGIADGFLGEGSVEGGGRHGE